MCQLVERSFEENVAYMKEKTKDMVEIMKGWNPDEERRKLYQEGHLTSDSKVCSKGGGKVFAN